MIKKIKSYLLVTMLALTFAAPALVPTAVYAAAGTGNCNDAIGSSIAKGANDAIGRGGNVTCNETGVGEDNISEAAAGIVRLFSIIVGVIAVIMIIYGGFRYITSGGDSGRVGSAKNSLIYAIVGLIIVAIAQLIVHFVLSQTNSITT